MFGDYASVGGARQSWTATCYILTAEFADIMPADEDPMPLNGNPHPLQGGLLPDPNNMVMPQYPEIGWDAMPQGNGQPEDLQQAQQPQQVMPKELLVQGSVVWTLRSNRRARVFT